MVKKQKKHYCKQILKYSSLFLLSVSLTGGAYGSYYVYNVIKDSPTLTDYQIRPKPTANMYDKDNRLIWSDTQNRRDYITLDKVPKAYVMFLISTEDDGYFEHKGFSPKGLINATISLAKEKLLHKGVARGGSTIEQQLIKNVSFSSDIKDRTIDRKIKELWLALQMDINIPKEKVLEYYVNLIFLGERSYGINTISLTYFGKPISDFNSDKPEDLSKLAIIAGLGQAPSEYNLYDNPDLVKKRRDIVLLSALQNEKINRKEYEAIKNVPVDKDLKPRYHRDDEIQKQMIKHSAYIQSSFRQLERLGYDIKKDALQVHTGLNSKLDDELQNIVLNKANFQDDEEQVAVTVMNDKSEVLGQVGGRFENKPLRLNRAIQKTRSSGSSIKPFLDYGSAIELLGYGTNFKLDSSPYRYQGTNFVAQNYGGYTYGIVDMKQALRYSLNTPALRLLDEHIGYHRSKAFMQNLGGLDIKDGYAGSDALGIDVSTEDLAAAFRTMANGGVYKEPIYIKSIDFVDGSSKEVKTKSHRGMKESTAFILLKILEGVFEENASAPNAKLNYKGHAVKTGTVGYGEDGVWRPEYAASDAWIAGTTKSITTVVWLGYDSPNLPNHWVSKETDTRYKIYKDVMTHFNKGKDTSDWVKPDSVLQVGQGLSADYSPLDSEVINLPETINFKNLPDVENVIDTRKDEQPVPKNYQIGKWKESIKDKDKLFLESYLSEQN